MTILTLDHNVGLETGFFSESNPSVITAEKDLGLAGA